MNVEAGVQDSVVSPFVHELGEVSRWQRFFECAINEVIDQPYKGREIQGPLTPVFKRVLDDLHTDATRFDNRLTTECLFPIGYRPSEAVATINSVVTTDDTRDQFENIRSEYAAAKAKAISDVIQPELEFLSSHEIPPGLLDAPNYRPMTFQMSCARTAFTMVMDAVADVSVVDDHALAKAVAKHYDHTIVDDEVYLKIMQSDAFQERFGVSVGSISFTGINLDIIAKLAAGLRKNSPSRSVYSVLSLLSDSSETARDAGIWHSAVLLGANSHSVLLHEPMLLSQGSGKNILLQKDQFINRWAQAYMRGHLIVVDQTDTQNS